MKANLFQIRWIAPLVMARPAPVRRARADEALPLTRRADGGHQPVAPARRLTRLWDEFNW